MTDGAPLAIEMTTRQWQTIDGTIDDELDTEIVNGDPRGIADLAKGIREAGWDQVAHWTPGVPGSGSWPPADATVSVSLSVRQWELVVSALDRWSEVSERVAHHDDARRQREARGIVAARLRS